MGKIEDNQGLWGIIKRAASHLKSGKILSEVHPAHYQFCLQDGRMAERKGIEELMFEGNQSSLQAETLNFLMQGSHPEHKTWLRKSKIGAFGDVRVEIKPGLSST